MNIHEISAKVRQLLASPPAPGLTSLARIGGLYCAVRHQLRSISLPIPAAVFVLRGTKIIWRGQERMAVPAGEMFLLPAGMEITIENQPDLKTGRYAALCLSFSESMIADAAVGCGASSGLAELGELRVRVDQPMLQTVTHLLDMSLAELHSDRLLDLCMAEILELISQRSSCLPLIWESVSNWTSRCGRMISLDPGRTWCAADVAENFCVSERALRRHLQSEGTSFRRILQDIRLGVGLGMLQSGSLNIGEVAYRCGYGSASRFAILFKERFGVSPSDVASFNADS